VLSRQDVPFVVTAHGRLDFAGLPRLIQHFPNAPLISISNRQREPLPEAKWLATVYHGMPTKCLAPEYAPGAYLAFLGRITPDKGPEPAIRIARASRLPLRIAAKVPRAEEGYFKERIAPLVDGDRVQFVGELGQEKKQEFLGGAAALLFPIDWPEPFGLVMIEAMACGTPVIAFRRGSVPEIVDDGLSGFVVDDEPAAVAAVGCLDRLDRRKVRAQFQRRFSATRMARDYVTQYEALIQGHPGRSVVISPAFPMTPSPNRASLPSSTAPSSRRSSRSR
jgi:glycosyltransferase involved in cell wall biosynthesis